MSAPDLRAAFAMPPEAALAYFRSKGYAISWDWRDVWQDAQARAHTVAGVMKIDALQAIRGRLDAALKEGQAFAQWQDALIPDLEKLGLWGRHKLLNEETGELKTLTPHRMQTIFRTNLQTAYMAARYQAQRENVEDRPYWEYVAVMDGRTRPSHAAMHGRVFRHDDPIWHTHYAPNGFNCRCRIRARTEAEVRAAGLAVSSSEGRLTSGPAQVWPDRDPIEVTRFEHAPGQHFTPDPGWNYNPGETWTRPFAPPPLDDLPRTFPEGVALPGMPAAARVQSARLLPEGLPPVDYARAFLQEFGADIGRPVVFDDVAGDMLTISDALFTDGRGNIKADKRGRGPYMRLLAETVREPDEIWMRWEESRAQPGTWLLKRRYLKVIELVSEDAALYGIGAFEYGRDGWSGSTVFPADAGDGRKRREYLEHQRAGFLRYRK
ncbi:PBECR2 nuclease fold domain-containing protein [Thauera butanivorans]|uniref:PBECR2 nuclease fold domain-containing protein n=1 Tax=Thauera butanivorans TaxID=86174 RepID=UPI003AB7DB57